jgi:sec-independent protein translocase protein TatC
MDHVRELQGRLFAVAIVFVLVSAAAYPFFDKIVNFLVAPLGKDNQLVYLTPGGAFSFIIQVCMYIGFVGALPAIIYNIYQFIMPAMKQQNGRRALIFTTISLLLAVAGMLFAYFVSLPAALYFLTSFNLYHINPMLTIDSYFSFIMTYMFAGALLFQIPLVMLMINGATPLTPKKLMRHQDKIILGSFIVAAIISPTPDALNQTLLASPIVVMYQVGIILVWLKNRKRAKARSQTMARVQSQVVAHAPALATTTSSRPVITASQAIPSAPVAVVQVPVQKRSGYSIDGFVAVPRRPIAIRPPAPRLSRPLPIVREAPARPQPVFRSTRRRSIDGFVMPA